MGLGDGSTHAVWGRAPSGQFGVKFPNTFWADHVYLTEYVKLQISRNCQSLDLPLNLPTSSGYLFLPMKLICWELCFTAVSLMSVYVKVCWRQTRHKRHQEWMPNMSRRQAATLPSQLNGLKSITTSTSRVQDAAMAENGFGVHRLPGGRLLVAKIPQIV